MTLSLTDASSQLTVIECTCVTVVAATAASLSGAQTKVSEKRKTCCRLCRRRRRRRCRRPTQFQSRLEYLALNACSLAGCCNSAAPATRQRQILLLSDCCCCRRDDDDDWRRFSSSPLALSALIGPACAFSRYSTCLSRPSVRSFAGPQLLPVRGNCFAYRWSCYYSRTYTQANAMMRNWPSTTTRQTTKN